MAGKRQATTNLNHDNWDHEEEPEERGTFRTATEDELKHRVIKKAKRKITAGNDSVETAGTAKSIFSGFSGFANASSTTSSGTGAFSFLSKIPTASASASAGLGGGGGGRAGGGENKSLNISAPTFSFGPLTKTGKNTEDGRRCENVDNASVQNKHSGKSDNYFAKLKGLNQAVSEWIKSHVDKNPLCLLTPIFMDYEKYLKEIEAEENSKKSNVSSAKTTEKTDTEKSTGTLSAFSGFKSSTSTAATVSTVSTPKFSFGVPTTATTGSATTTVLQPSFAFGVPTSSTSSSAKTSSPPTFMFGVSSSASATTPTTTTTNIFGGVSTLTSVEPEKTNGFSFGIKSDSKAPKSSDTKALCSNTASYTGFTFGKPSTSTEADDKKPMSFSFTANATPFIFGNIQPPSSDAKSTETKEENDEEDQPPKVEFKKVIEDDAVFSKKCKVYVMKDKTYVDRGVGTLYLKPVKDSNKTQLLVRADTNLGNILVNLILNSALPIERKGKKDVMMVCLPTPDEKKPMPMLLRVKTPEEADELLTSLEKYKK